MTEKFCKKCGTAITGKFCSNCGTRFLTPLEELRKAEQRAEKEFCRVCEKSKLLNESDAFEVAKVSWRMAFKRFHPNYDKYTTDSQYIPADVFGELNSVRANAYSMFVSMASVVNAMWK